MRALSAARQHVPLDQRCSEERLICCSMEVQPGSIVAFLEAGWLQFEAEEESAAAGATAGVALCGMGKGSSVTGIRYFWGSHIDDFMLQVHCALDRLLPAASAQARSRNPLLQSGSARPCKVQIWCTNDTWQQSNLLVEIQDTQVS